MKHKKLILFLVVLFSSITQLTFPQNDSTSNKNQSNIVQSAIEKLQQKILIDEDQSMQIEKILSSNIKADTLLKNQETILENIAKLLNNRQKAKYDIIKEEWWNNFIKMLKE